MIHLNKELSLGCNISDCSHITSRVGIFDRTPPSPLSVTSFVNLTTYDKKTNFEVNSTIIILMDIYAHKVIFAVWVFCSRHTLTMKMAFVFIYFSRVDQLFMSRDKLFFATKLLRCSCSYNITDVE